MNDLMVKYKETVQALQNNSETAIAIDYYRVKKVALMLRSINHKTRQRMIKLIDNKRKISVGEIYASLRLNQSVVSLHLSILRKAGIVMAERDGRFIYYTINHKRIQEINQLIQGVLTINQ
jgi:DNA-binding transcriptional ArsR family regulator